MHELLCTYITPHDKSCYRYIPIDLNVLILSQALI